MVILLFLFIYLFTGGYKSWLFPLNKSQRYFHLEYSQWNLKVDNTSPTVPKI